MPIDPEILNQVKGMQTSEPAAHMMQGSNIDPEILAQVKKSSQPATLEKPANAFHAGIMGFNKVFEDFTLGVLDKVAGVAGAENVHNNIKALYEKAQQQEQLNQELYPTATTVGNIAGNVALTAPVGVASGGGSLLAQAGKGALALGAMGAASDMSGNPLKRGVQDALIGGASTLAAGALMKGLATGANAVKGVLSDTGEQIKDLSKQTGVTDRVIDYMPSWIKKTFDLSGDMPFSGTPQAFASRHDQITKNINGVVKGYYSQLKEAPYTQSMVDLVKSAADPNDANNFAAQKLLKDLANDDTWTAIVKNSGNLKSYAVKQAYNEAKGSVLAEADKLGGIPVQGLVKQLDDAMKTVGGEASRSKLGFSSGTIDELTKLREALTATATQEGDNLISFSQLENIQNNLQNVVSKMFDAKGTVTSGDLKIMQGMKKAIDNTQMNFLKSTDAKLWNTLRDLKGAKAQEMAMWENSLLAKAFDSSSPGDAMKQLMRQASKGTDIAKNLYEILDDKGRAAIKAGYIDDLFSRYRTDDAMLGEVVNNLKPERLLNRLKNSEDFLHTFFKPEEIKQVKGAINVMKFMDGYNNALIRNPSGRMDVDYKKFIGLATAGAVSPVGAVNTIAAATLFNRVMNSTLGTRLLAAATTIEPNTPAFVNIVDKMLRIAAASVPANTNDTTSY